MRLRLIVTGLVTMVAIFASSAESASPAVTAKQDSKVVPIVAPPPRYPLDAQGQRPMGHGVVLMEIDVETGRVKSVKIHKSTGHKILDEAAIQAFRRWRFKPGTPRFVHSPISFADPHESQLGDATMPSAEQLRKDSMELDRLEAMSFPDPPFNLDFWLESRRVADKTGPRILHALMQRCGTWRRQREGMIFSPLVTCLPRKRTLRLLRAYERSPQKSHQIWARDFLFWLRGPRVISN